MSDDHATAFESGPDEFQHAWQAQSSRTRLAVDVDRLSMEVQQFQRDFRSTILWRDVREVATSLVLIIVWFVMGISLSLPWTWYLTVPVLAWVAGFMWIDRRRHPKDADSLGEPLLFYVKASLKQVEHQIWLLRNVFWWYLMPFVVSIMAFFIHIAWRSTSTWWGLTLFAGLMGMFLLVTFWFVYRQNQNAVSEQLEPRRNDLARLVASLEGDPSREAAGDVMNIVSALGSPEHGARMDFSWRESWNELIPSWREAAVIAVPTLVGALCVYRYPISGMGTMFFQTVVAAVIPFQIAFGIVWWRRRRADSASGIDQSGDADETTCHRLRTPAILVMVLTITLPVLAVLAVGSFVSDFSSGSRRGPGLGQISEFGDDDVRHIDSWLQRLVKNFYPSLGVVVVRDGETAYQGVFGFEDIASGKMATPQTQYHVASVTKAFTASLAVILHERGDIDLDHPVSQYLPAGVAISSTPNVGSTITLRQLASHASGLPRGVPGQVQTIEGWYQLEPQRLYDHLARVELESEPGSRESYSNLGFGLLGHALELAAEQRLDRLMLELVCQPLGLERTEIQSDGTVRPATGYDHRRHSISQHSFQQRLAGSGGLVTSVEDLAKLLAAQMEPGVLTGEMLGQLHDASRLSDGTAAGTALGWSVRTRDSIGRVLKKNGGRRNCSAWIGFSPEHKVGVAVVTNCGGPDVDPIGYELLERAIPASRPSGDQ
ncbi:MAG: serine hydrolase domain-containing protein [Planctomycetota bacterium]